MKRIITSITIVIIMFLCIGWLSNQEHTYNSNDVDTSLIGKTITVVMNDNYTDSNIKDDKIIDVKQ